MMPSRSCAFSSLTCSSTILSRVDIALFGLAIVIIDLRQPGQCRGAAGLSDLASIFSLRHDAHGSPRTRPIRHVDDPEDGALRIMEIADHVRSDCLTIDRAVGGAL